MMSETETQSADRGHVVVGAAIVLLGLAFLADQSGAWHLTLSSRMWPFILLFMGLARMAWPRQRDGRPSSRRGGVWLLSIGIWGLISEYRLFGLHYGSSWPLLVVAAGINMVWRAFDEPKAPGRLREN